MSEQLREMVQESGLLDEMRLNKKKYININESKSLIAVYESNLFVWNDFASCIITTEIKKKRSLRENCLKTLILSSPPVFDVEFLLFNHTGSLLALSGKNGVMIYEVPWRYGRFSSSSATDDSIIGRSWNIAENFFVYSSKVAVVQVAWHPGSSSNAHLTVLSTDNYLRTYDVTDPQTPQQVISLCSKAKNTFLSSESKITFSTCFGENCMSFDFGSPEEVQVPQLSGSKMSRKYETVTAWPVYLLHGNGDVFIAKSPLNRNGSAVKVLGPLAMYPPSEDNYGYDACSILCLNTVPNCIVIATTNGIIYHSVILEDIPGLEKQHHSWAGSIPSEEPEIALYVFERVEISLSLTEEQDDVFSQPIRLYKDIMSKCRYHCSHVSGIHSIAVPFLLALEQSLDIDNLLRHFTEESKLPSIVEHTICTKPFSQMESVPVLGMDVLIDDAGATMLCLLASWDFIALPLVSSFFSSLPHLLSDDYSLLRESDRPSVSLFEEQIEKTLQRSICCPYLKSSEPAQDSQQWLDLLCSATQRFREDYIQRLATAQALLRSRIKVLCQQKEYQLRDINKTVDERDALKSSAEKLAEKYEDAQSSQQTLLKRIESVLLKFQQNLPYISKAELDMKDTLVTYEEKLKLFETSLEQIKKKLKQQKDKFKDTGDQDNTAMQRPDACNLNLNEKQIKHVKELLAQESESISELMKKLSLLKKQCGS